MLCIGGRHSWLCKKCLHRASTHLSLWACSLAMGGVASDLVHLDLGVLPYFDYVVTGLGLECESSVTTFQRQLSQTLALYGNRVEINTEVCHLDPAVED